MTPDPREMNLPPATFSPEIPEKQRACEELNSLLRGEISAAETYTMAISKVSQSDKSHESDVKLLREIQAEHGRAAQALRARVRDLGGQAVDSSGAWGAWAKTVEATAGLFGDKAALKALKEGEEHGLKQYEESSDEIDMNSVQLVASELIPAQRLHIELLDRLINSVGKA
jgi:hypothetical protein